MIPSLPNGLCQELVMMICYCSFFDTMNDAVIERLYLVCVFPNFFFLWQVISPLSLCFICGLCCHISSSVHISLLICEIIYLSMRCLSLCLSVCLSLCLS